MNQCQSMGYDEFDRLSSVSGSGGPGNASSTYDRWGNRTNQNGSPSVMMPVKNSNNQSTNYLYDAAGNQLNDSVHSYFYDAEGEVLGWTRTVRPAGTPMTRWTSGSGLCCPAERTSTSSTRSAAEYRAGW